ncbi:two-component sensor histidine kinase [Tsuneonella deserti]|uniref:histidine kinase n=1 Tax=Tsuneonella deserti TaxID=2035528 RepID=A0ABQ1S2A8_9SPHN|nr:ATP-binding protein [Tsuneonella deserti]GGD87961.1 two-component sensor histidine kinase [Tsuneonella deserti]
MEQGRTLPLAGVLIAVVAGIGLALAGTSLLVAAATVLVWLATLWLVQPPPAPTAARTDVGIALTPEGMRDLVEHSGLPTVILDGNRVIVANAGARETLGPHIIGQDARVALRHPAAVDLLNRTSGGSATIQGLTGPQSSWQMSRQPFGDRFALVELINRTAEIDISRAHTDFVANASHELRTPLASIIGYVETLIDKSATIEPEQRERFLGIVLREARRLQELVADLMSLSQIEAEKHDQPREHVDLVALAGRAARDSAGAARHDRLRLGGQAAPLAVLGDPKQLEQLVRNLVDNALKYGAADSEVTVEVENDGRGMAVLKVRDRGDGIPSQHIPHLTRRFYRVDPGRSRAAGGTGLGLAIVKHIVERHRGRLDIASRVGEGTTVTVRLPIAS